MFPPTSRLNFTRPNFDFANLMTAIRPRRLGSMDTNAQSQETSVLYQNETKSVFLIDIPYSIALAQDLPAPKPAAGQEASSPQSNRSIFSQGNPPRRRYLLSSSPRKAPYPSSNEPKKAAARAKVLKTIPPSERLLHGDFIQPLVRKALQEIKDNFSEGQSQWCRPRYVIDNDDDGSFGPRKRKSESLGDDEPLEHSVPLPPTEGSHGFFQPVPPLILSSTSTNSFASRSDLRGVIKNPSSDPAVLGIGSSQGVTEYTVPPQSNFVHCTLPLASTGSLEDPIPGIPPSQKFNLILFDPPWPNRSVRRSGHYETYNYTEMDILTQRLQDILRVHANSPNEPSRDTSTRGPQTESPESIAAIWITNSKNSRKAAYEAMLGAGFHVSEEWVWIKTTIDGQPVSPVDGLWKRPYEMLVVGRRAASSKPVAAGPSSESFPPDIDFTGIDPASLKRRVIAAVPDLHSRKPCLRDVFERVFYPARASENGLARESYTVLEVFARNLTAGWWACGNEVLKFNDRKCWQEPTC